VEKVVDASGKPQWQVGSRETLFNVAQMVNAGYAFIAPDYIGLGINNSEESYTLKDATNPSVLGMLEASRSILAELGVQPKQLFLSGWSQGALNSAWMTQRCESLAIPVAATGLAAPPLDWFGQFFWDKRLDLKYTGDPSNPIDLYVPASWKPLGWSKAIQSYEYWYQLSGLFEALIRDDVIPDRQFISGSSDLGAKTYETNIYKLTYREVTRGWTKDYGSVLLPPNAPFNNLIWTVRIPDSKRKPGDPETTTIPAFTVKEMLLESALDGEQSVSVGAFLDRLKFNSAKDWNYKTSVKAWFGTDDVDLPAEMVNPALAIDAGPNFSLVPVEGGTHRLALLNALYATPQNPGGTDKSWLEWFASKRNPLALPPQLVLNNQQLRVISEEFGLLPLLVDVQQQRGERPLHVQIRRIRQDGTSEVIGSIGATTSTGGQLQTRGQNRVLLQVGDRLGFDLLAREGGAVVASRTEIVANPDGLGYGVTVITDAGQQPATLGLSLRTDRDAFSPSQLDRIAAPQSSAADGLLQLQQGQVLQLQVTSDCFLVNRIGFVRLNSDPVTGLPDYTVGSQRITIGSSAFHDQIDALLAPGFRHQQSGRRVVSDLQWTVNETGTFAPVLITSEGNVFSVSNSDTAFASEQHLRLLGTNTFGFEDLNSRTSDWDWNDIVISVIGLSADPLLA
jgi:pimeloyl-ACP methyl ester carboxylesterase